MCPKLMSATTMVDCTKQLHLWWTEQTGLHFLRAIFWCRLLLTWNDQTWCFVENGNTKSFDFFNFSHYIFILRIQLSVKVQSQCLMIILIPLQHVNRQYLKRAFMALDLLVRVPKFFLSFLVVPNFFFTLFYRTKAVVGLIFSSLV